MTLTLQVLETPQKFLKFIGDADNVSMSLVVGAAHDASQRSDENQKSIWMVLHGKYTDGDQTIQTSYDSSLTAQSPIWIVCCSHNLETYYITWSTREAGILSIVPQVIETIVKALVSVKVPTIHAVMGPKLLADQFLAAWSTCVEPPLTIREEAFLKTRLAYITSSECAETQRKRGESGENGVHEVLDVTTLKYDRNSPEMKAVRSQLVQSILPFCCAIGEEGAGPAAEKMVDELLDRRDQGRLFFIREMSGSEIAGYLYTGRETKNTVGVRYVYTKEAFRGRGVAKELVGAACKWWLLEADGDKKKQVVTLFVAPDNPVAMRVYLRSGFRVEEEPWEHRGFNGVSMGAF